jgi:hypothetical protein
MRFALVALFALSAACSRSVVVETAPSTDATASLRVTNRATQAVSVYVTGTGPELFLKSVAANSTELIPVPGIASGTTVRLRATLADGSRSYTRDGVVLTGTFDWTVP